MWLASQSLTGELRIKGEACFKIWIESESCKHMVSSSVLCRHIHKVHRYISSQILFSSWDMTPEMRLISHSVSLSVSFSLFVSFIHNAKQRDNNIQISPKEVAWERKKMVLENEIGFAALILSHCEPLPSTAACTDPSLTTQYMAFDYDCQLKITENSCILFYHS